MLPALRGALEFFATLLLPAPAHAQQAAPATQPVYDDGGGVPPFSGEATENDMNRAWWPQESAGGFPQTTIEFATPQLARYIRLVLTESRLRWWCITELYVQR